jgi:hypothetical protein
MTRHTAEPCDAMDAAEPAETPEAVFQSSEETGVRASAFPTTA